MKAFGSILYALGIDPLQAQAEDEKPQEEAPEEIKKLAQERWEAKKSKDFAKADELRGKISAAGWAVLDTKDGFTLHKA